MGNHKVYDCAIIGGGLAGLCLSIQLAKKGHAVVLFEKNKYPFHKVCGEYVSNESRNFLIRLGISLNEMSLPQINHLGISSLNGFMLSAPLDLGGFGISRYTLDHELSEIAKREGVTLIEKCKVTDVNEKPDFSGVKTSQGDFFAKIICGSYGKLSPAFMNENKEKHNKYIAVKYHIKAKIDDNRIELHNFRDGYCGISMVDNNTACLCYLTTSENLRKNNNSIKQMEENVLMQNPFLRRYFNESEFLFDEPLTISKIGFKKKAIWNNGVFLLGDASGAIAPLSGNGMSIGMRTSQIFAELLDKYFKQKISKKELIDHYDKAWSKNFSVRLKTGFYLQKFLGKNLPTVATLKFLKVFPRLTRKIISLTHGQAF